MINYGRQYLDKYDINAVIKSLKGNLITQGPYIKKFEADLSKKFGSKYCAVVSSGTAALHLLGLALKWKKNEIILTTPISFLATSNTILYSGATPEFVDIDKDTYNLDPDLLLKRIIQLKKKKKKIVAVICPDFAGQPCDWKKLRKIADKYKLILINDCCHAMGSKLDWNPKYAMKFADFVSLSFHPVKTITSGEGGAILTNDKKIHEKINVLKSHGIIKKKNFDPWFYQMKYLGFNYRITDFQCALGSSQLKKLEKFVHRRKNIASNYDKAFENIKGINIPKIKKNNSSAYHLYPLLINFRKFGVSKRDFFLKLRNKKINLQVHYIPIHLQPYYKNKLNLKKGDFPVAENFYEKEVSLPVYYNLKNTEQNKVIFEIKKILKVN
ncbi:UDP-4-amino-4,6-dideoxy-N-acetyl-beta-L-altrosamine transaminase [Pelagibacteraceae bacterium]|nr:UDP-4-amino-4,6-dideoxy-N-acetyl-beta-L-altrosamine transaminase [Pelagibacteraceae bacterium]